MRAVLLLILICICFSCKNNAESDSENTPISSEKQTKKIQQKPAEIEDYENDKWGFLLSHPENFKILESQLAGDVPVINLYPENLKANPPFAIHEKPEMAYIAILPEGFGVDGPSGEQMSFAKWKSAPDFEIDLNTKESKVYQLENGEAWAYYLRFKQPPKGWSEYGGIFVHFGVSDFKATCFNSKSGESKPMSECDPMGEDKVKYSGEIDTTTKNQILKILKSFKFKNDNQKEISDLIKVEKPLPNIDVQSPLKIEGKARGQWFFEADAPVEILDKDFKKIAEGYIKAEGEWMTSDFVNFSGTIDFEAPDDERGYLLFKRANPSDLKENDREYRIPIIFPPK